MRCVHKTVMAQRCVLLYIGWSNETKKENTHTWTKIHTNTRTHERKHTDILALLHGITDVRLG